MAEPERRYTISELLQIAEDRTLIAKILKQEGGCGAVNQYYEWSNVMFALRFLRDQGLPELNAVRQEVSARAGTS